MTDYYSVIESALATQLRTLTSHFPNTWQVSLADETALDKGASEFALIYPGAFPNMWHDANFNKTVEWEMQLDLMVRFVDYATTFAALKALRSDVLNLLMDKRSLGRTNNVRDILIAAEERPQGVYKSGATEKTPPAFLAQRLLVTVTAYASFK